MTATSRHWLENELVMNLLVRQPGSPSSRVALLGAAVCAVIGTASTARADNTVVVDEASLEAAEAAGAAFSRVMAKAPAHATDQTRLVDLPLWQSIASVLKRDVGETQRADKRAGVGIAGNAHRLFDVGWLASADARFSLVGIAARFDRRAFHAAGCGEIRLIYRLGYQLPATKRRAALASFLPLTVSIELLPSANGSGCGRVFEWWKRATHAAGASRGTALLDPKGYLRAALDDRRRWHRIAVNFQRVRWPSAVRPDLGGHAEYVLRAFAWDAGAGAFVAAPLENTPEVASLRRGSKRWKELRNWLADPRQRRAIDAGTVTIPEKFLATRSLSVTPRGLARLANRPFRQVFRPADFASLPYSNDHALRSPAAFIRRLDGISCAGCHQSRAVAGFHWIGMRAMPSARPKQASALAEQSPSVAAPPDTAVAFSPHVAADLPRRQRALQTAHGDDGSIRPFAERSELDRGPGSACGLGDLGFADWTCSPGLRCAAISGLSGDGSVGECVPATPQVGDACQPAQISAVRDATRDRARATEEIPCAAGLVCQATRVGFPGGMCSGSCAPLPAGGACGAIAILTPFNNCLARGQPFSHCAQQHSHPAGLAACSQHRPCRDDYICTHSEAAGAGEGTCIPPYFLLSLRVDGHPLAAGRTDR